MVKTNSGSYWVTWANANAKNSDKIVDLAEPFRTNVKAFIQALEDAGATVSVTATKRAAKRAYLFHWSWKIALGKVKPSAAKPMVGVDIEWDHSDLKASKAGAKEMVHGFGLAIPPDSNVAPSLTSNHIAGNAIDMGITWTGNIQVAKKDGKLVKVAYMTNANVNGQLHTVGASYRVIKHMSDKPHWSYYGW